MENNAIFIGGHRRSGTTLLLHLFDNHPEINVFPADSGFFISYFPGFDTGKYTLKEKVQCIIKNCYINLKDELKEFDPQNSLNVPFRRLYNNLRRYAAAGKATTREMLLAMVLAYRDTYYPENQTHKYWLEKTSSTEIYAGYIFKWFPQAKFIHLVRDPRDNYASLKSGWETRYKYRNDDPRRLLQSMLDRGLLGLKLASLNRERYGKDHYYIIRYEDLVADTEKEMKKLSRFLGIRFHLNLLTPTIAGLLWGGNNFNGKRFKKPSRSSVGRWQKRIDPQEAKVIEFYFRDIMKKFRYKPHFNMNECIDAAAEHYKWYNFAQRYNG